MEQQPLNTASEGGESFFSYMCFKNGGRKEKQENDHDVQTRLFLQIWKAFSTVNSSHNHV